MISKTVNFEKNYQIQESTSGFSNLYLQNNEFYFNFRKNTNKL